MRDRFVRDHCGRFQVRRMCRVLEISSSGYYAWLRRPESGRVREDRRLLVEIKAIHQENRKTYGSPRIHAELKDRQLRHGKKRVPRLMRKNGIRAKQKKKFKATTDSRHSHPVAPTLLQRNFEADMPGQKWLADITYSAPGSRCWHRDARRDLSMTGIHMDKARRQEGPMSALCCERARAEAAVTCRTLAG